MKGLRFISINNNGGSEKQQILTFQRLYVTSCCTNYSRKLLPSTTGIDHFLDTRIIKFEAINYVVLTSLKL